MLGAGGQGGGGAIILAITHRQDWCNKQAYHLMIERPRDRRGEGREAGNDYSPTVDLYMEHEQSIWRARDQFLTVFGACPESGAAQRQRQSGGRWRVLTSVVGTVLVETRTLTRVHTHTHTHTHTSSSSNSFLVVFIPHPSQKNALSLTCFGCRRPIQKE